MRQVLKREDIAKKFINFLSNKKARVTEIKKTKQKENAPLLFNLAEIQNECTKRFKIKPDETLEVIQNLYEKKLVTYPRTDARVLSTAVAKEINKNLNGIAKGYKDEEMSKLIKQMVEEKYSTDIVKTKYVNDSKITDHYAIIPTGQGYENYEGLNSLQKQVYDLIVRRFIAIFFPPAEYSKVNVTLNVENENFYANGKVCLKRGFLDVLKPEKKNEQSLDKEEIVNKNSKKCEDSENEENNSSLEILKLLKKGDELNEKNFEIKDAETSPPSRYNSGTIIKVAKIPPK